MRLEIHNGRNRRNSLTVTIYPTGDHAPFKVISVPARAVLEIEFEGVEIPAVEVHSGTISVWGNEGGKLISATISTPDRSPWKKKWNPSPSA